MLFYAAISAHYAKIFLMGGNYERWIGLESEAAQFPSVPDCMCK